MKFPLFYLLAVFIATLSYIFNHIMLSYGFKRMNLSLSLFFLLHHYILSSRVYLLNTKLNMSLNKPKQPASSSLTSRGRAPCCFGAEWGCVCQNMRVSLTIPSFSTYLVVFSIQITHKQIHSSHNDESRSHKLLPSNCSVSACLRSQRKSSPFFFSMHLLLVYYSRRIVGLTCAF